jgi:dCTP diphosphatase
MPLELEEIMNAIHEFAEQRDWSQFHTTKNLVLAISAELGELAEIVQWRSDSELAEYLKTPEGKNKLSEEIADISIYLLRICQQLELNFLDIISKKIEVNTLKYPVEKSKGNYRKYTELSN